MQTQPLNNLKIKATQGNPISFKGYKGIIDNKGREFIEFYAPAYDREKYDLSLQTVSVKLDEKSNWVVEENEKPLEYPKSSAAFEKDGVFYVSKKFLTGRGALTVDSSGNETGLGYQFVLTSKDGSTSFPVQESGVKTSDGKFNVISANNGLTSRTGTMYHAFFNSLSPSKKAKEAKAIRTHFNDFGTTIQNVRDLLKTGVLDPYSLILSTPLTGKMHGYWSENLFQICPSLGSMEDFKGLQGDLFDKGMSWVNDGTFTSQGLKSPQFQDVLKWGKESPYYHWFKMGGDKIEVGILPEAVIDPLSGKKNEGRKHVKYAIINAPGKKDYDKSKPTYIQFYDDRLVDDAPTEIMENYPKYNDKDPYALKMHQDSVVPYYFEIDPKKIDMKMLSAKEGTPVSDIENVKDLFDFATFAVVDKKDAKGMNNWDGNTDIVKMNLSNPNTASSENKIGNVQVRNFLYQIASYWTKTSTDGLLEYNAINLAKDKEGTLQKVSSAFGVNLKGVVENIENGSYRSQFLESSEKQNASEFLLDQISRYPLEAIEFKHDLSATLGSPYITMRPVIPEDQALTRYDMIKDNYTPKDLYGDTVNTGKSYAEYMAQELPEEDAKIVKTFLPTSEKMNEIYRNQIMDFVRSTLIEMDNFTKKEGNADTERLIFKDSNNKELTPYGKYVAKIITPEIVKFAIVSALFGNDCVNVNSQAGEIKYNYESLGKKGISDLGIPEDTPKNKAKFLVEHIADGMKVNLGGTYNKNLASVFTKRLSGATLKDFEASEAILQQTKSGLNWRFDALKDVADLESRRNYTISFEKCWDDVIEFWGNFMKSVKSENPASYSIAEITDIGDFDEGPHKMSKGIEDFQGNDFGKYVNENVAVRTLLEKTGITTFTNYSYLFRPIVALFGQWFEDGSLGSSRGDMVRDLSNKYEDFLKFGPLTAINGAHNTISNPDKLHPIHLLSLNAELFTKGNPDAYDMPVVTTVVGEEYKNNILSSKAIAVGQIFNDYFDRDDNIPENTKKYLKRAVAVLALGKTTEDNTEKTDFLRADTFGARDFSITLNDVVKLASELAEKEKSELVFSEDSNNLDLKKEADRDIFVDKAYEEITRIARGKFAKIWKMYVGLGGNATLFNGDEYAQSGFEGPAKNHHVNNREMVNHDVVKNPRRAGTAEYNKEINATSALHKRKELSALADGTPVSLGIVGRYGQDVGQAVYKNNNKGSEIITINTTVGMVNEWDRPMRENPDPVTLDKFYLNLKGGLTVDTKFKKLCYDKAKGDYVNAKDKYYLNGDKNSESKYFGSEEEYIVRRDNTGNKYYLEKVVRQEGDYKTLREIQLDDSTIILYKPESDGNSGTISFKGNPHVALANLKYNIPV